MPDFAVIIRGSCGSVRGMRLARLGIVGIVLLVSSVAGAQGAPPPPPPPGGYTTATEPGPAHDGFYLRLMLGGGYAEMTNSQTGQDVKISGNALGLDINLGYFLSPNLALGADLYGSGVQGPTLSVNGQTMTADSSTQLTFAGVAGGITYFIPDPNVYLGASIGLAQGSVQMNGQTQSRSPQGWGVHLLAGKEWWVSPHWGIGLAVDFFKMSLPDDNNSTDSVLGGGLLFSSSYSGG